ncbi:TPA: 4'-phosphopantetheinyl transferase superfamily protein [Pseudomonas aeruginosa]|nr:4'-phosphopantetheinyl transferase superfamily protein [Pseudomonas aeruginosa]
MDRDEVRTWSMETHEVPEWALREFSQVLAPWERCRADQYLSPLDRRDYLCAHVLRRVLLSHCFHRPVRDWVFEANAFGKPAVLNRPPCGRFECNLSHTRGVVAVITALDRAVGIDVERQDRSVEVDLAVLVCSPAEATILHATPQSRQREKLLQLWVRKEALTKAIGRGLSMALPLMEVGDLPPVLVPLPS